MMMTQERPRENEENKEDEHINISSDVRPTESKTPEDAIKDLERRLGRLGGASTTEVSKTEKHDPPPVVAKKNDVLLARIMAAQERARTAQKEQQEKMREEEAKMGEEELMLAELNREIEDSGSDAEEKKSSPEDECPAPPFEVLEKQMEEELPTPPFEVLEKQMEEELPPPPFEVIEQQQPELIAPSAPAEDTQSADNAVSDMDFSALYPHILEPPSGQSSAYNTEGLQQSIFQEQLRILGQIQSVPEQETSVASADETIQHQNTLTNAATSNATTAVIPPPQPQQTIQLAPDHYVPLHGPEKTRQAIAQGTAVLVQCLNCQNFLQITSTATLMYCPCCHVVSPVEYKPQLTKEEAMQEMNDRKLAQKLQDEEWGNSEQQEQQKGYFSSFMDSIFPESVQQRQQRLQQKQQQQNASSSQQPQQQQKTWSEYMGSFIWSKNSTAQTAVAVSPPTASMPSTTTTAIPTTTTPTLVPVQTGHEEHVSLLQSSPSPPPARIAERKPFYSCILDGANSMAESVSKGFTAEYDEEPNQYHGVDTSSLLAVSQVGRKKEDEDEDEAYDEYRPLKDDSA